MITSIVLVEEPPPVAQCCTGADDNGLIVSVFHWNAFPEDLEEYAVRAIEMEENIPPTIPGIAWDGKDGLIWSEIETHKTNLIIMAIEAG